MLTEVWYYIFIYINTHRYKSTSSSILKAETDLENDRFQASGKWMTHRERIKSLLWLILTCGHGSIGFL